MTASPVHARETKIHRHGVDIAMWVDVCTHQLQDQRVMSLLSNIFLLTIPPLTFPGQQWDGVYVPEHGTCSHYNFGL